MKESQDIAKDHVTLIKKLFYEKFQNITPCAELDDCIEEAYKIYQNFKS